MQQSEQHEQTAEQPDESNFCGESSGSASGNESGGSGGSRSSARADRRRAVHGQRAEEAARKKAPVHGVPAGPLRQACHCRWRVALG